MLSNTQAQQASPQPDPLAGVQPREAVLPPGVDTVRIDQLSPLLPLLSQLNATVVASWVPIIEQLDPNVLTAYVPLINGLSNDSIQAIADALPFLNVTSVIELLPAINAVPSKILEAYIIVLGKVRHASHCWVAKGCTLAAAGKQCVVYSSI